MSDLEEYLDTSVSTEEGAAIMKRLIDGERDADVLTKKMTANGKQLVMQLLDELAKLSNQ